MIRRTVILTLVVVAMIVAVGPSNASVSSLHGSAAGGSAAGDSTAADSPEAQYLVDRYGVAPDDAEARIARQPEIHVLLEAIEKVAGSRYAGASVDHENGGRLRVYVTAAGAAGLEQQATPPGLQVQEVVVAHSRSDLEMLVYQVHAAVADAGSLDSVRASLMESTNTVLVEVDPTVAIELSDSLASLEAAAGGALTIVEAPIVNHLDTCTSRLACDPPIRGALKICRSGCASIGFIAKSGSTRYALTSLHGGSGGTGYYHATPNGQDTIGNSSQIVYSGSVDAAEIVIANQTFWQPDNLIYGSSQSYTVTSYAIKSVLFDGDVVCRYGYKSTDCGTITTYCSTYGPLTCIPRANDMSACGGDSGGPYMAAHQAYGMHVGSNGADTCPGPATEDSWFTAISDVQTALAVQILTS